MSTTTVEVVAAGPLSTVQDLGRYGVMALGVPVSGALDLPSHRLANRLVGNAPERAGIESTMGGLALRFSADVEVAVTGADVDVFVGSRQEGCACLLRVPAGEVLRLGFPRAGLRNYVAVAGGVDAEVLYGSRSTDLLSGLGPAPLSDGDVLPLGTPDETERVGARLDQVPVAWPAEHVTCRVFPGPRRDWLVADAWHTLVTSTYLVGARSNRIGVRLEGPALERAREGELHSEGLVTGAIQVPGDGQPVVFLADHPTTGGYPVIGRVHADDLPMLGQIVPGGTVRFAAG